MPRGILGDSLCALPQRSFAWNLRRHRLYKSYQSTPSVVAERLPNLEKITFDIRNPTLTPEAISNLSALKRLHTVCFDVNEGYHLTPGNTGNWFTIIDFMHKRKAVMVAFQNIPQRDGFQKRLVVKYERQSEVYIFDATPS